MKIREIIKEESTGTIDPLEYVRKAGGDRKKANYLGKKLHSDLIYQVFGVRAKSSRDLAKAVTSKLRSKMKDKGDAAVINSFMESFVNW